MEDMSLAESADKLRRGVVRSNDNEASISVEKEIFNWSSARWGRMCRDQGTSTYTLYHRHKEKEGGESRERRRVSEAKASVEIGGRYRQRRRVVKAEVGGKGRGRGREHFARTSPLSRHLSYLLQDKI